MAMDICIFRQRNLDYSKCLLYIGMKRNVSTLIRDRYREEIVRSFDLLRDEFGTTSKISDEMFLGNQASLMAKYTQLLL